MQNHSIRGFSVLCVLFFLTSCADLPAHTVENVQNSIRREMNASKAYAAYADVAHQEGYQNLVNLFNALSYSEEVQARSKMRVLNYYGKTYLPYVDSFGIGNTLENLQAATEWKAYSAREVYPLYRHIAAEGNHRQLERLFGWSLHSSDRHQQYLKKVADLIEKTGCDRGIFHSWSVCPECGGLHPTASLPDFCLRCQTPASEFKLFQF